MGPLQNAKCCRTWREMVPIKGVQKAYKQQLSKRLKDLHD